MPVTNIIDISYAQPVASINWQRIHEQNIGAIIRSGQNTYEDNLFRQHYAGAIAAKVPAGMYWFYQPDQRPEAQALACINVWKSLTIRPKVIALDVEPIVYTGVSIFPPSKETHTAWLQSWLDLVEDATGIVPMVYTRADYWDVWVLRRTTWNRYPLWVASWTNYSGDVRMPLDWDTWRVWQYEGGTGRTEGVIGPVDQNEYNGSTHEMVQEYGGEVYNMTTANIFKKDKAIADRGRFVWFSVQDKDVNIQATNPQVGAMMLHCVTQQTGNMTVYSDAAFETRVDRATVPVMAVVGLDANYAWNNEIDLDDWRLLTLWNSPTVKAFINQWRKVTIPQSEWDAQHLNITANDGGWHKLGGIVLHMTGFSYVHGGTVNGMWQTALMDNMLKPLVALMAGGYIPTVKIYVAANREWFALYKNDATWELGKRIDARQVAGAGLFRVWGQAEAGLIEEVPMATPAATLSELWQYGVSDTYAYPLTLPGYEFQFFVYSWNRIRATNVFYENAIVTPIVCGLWCDTTAAMQAELGGLPPVEPPDLTARVVALEAGQAALELLTEQLTTQLIELKAWRAEWAKVNLPK